jgi:hypothetical protein
MQRLNKNANLVSASSLLSARKSRYVAALLLVLGSALMISACGSGSSSSSQSTGGISGNWQFTMTSPDPNYPAATQYALQGGFLLQSNGNVNGQALYSVVLDQLVNGLPVICNAGSATITGTVSGQTVTLTAVAGPQTFQLTGTLSADGSSITSGQFTTTGGGTVNNAVCGAATTQGTPGVWSAISVPPLAGSVSGTFHSKGLALTDEDFALTGTLAQGPNVGASSATVTGSLSFLNPTTLISNYPCFSSGSVNVTGQISGNTVILELLGTNGAQAGQIGIPAAEVAGSQLSQVTFAPVAPSGTYVLHATGEGYQVNTSTCTDVGYVCIALNNAAPCQQPITLTPNVLIFSPQLLVCTSSDCSPNAEGTAATQTLTLTNNLSSGSAPLTNLVLQFQPQQESDFTGLPDFTESDNCSSFLSSSTAGQSCTITIAFTPQESCNWLPSPGIASSCPLQLGALLSIQSPITNDNDSTFSVSITGTGLSYLQPSASEMDFGAEAVGEAGQSQLLSFTNQSGYPVQILGPQNTPCKYTSSPTILLPRPLINDGAVSGLQVITATGSSFSGNPPSITYSCDADIQTGLPNFLFSADNCTGALIPPQGTCSLEIGFVPQPFYMTAGQGFDFFLELNTLECFPGSAGSDCEIDSGRFPVELKADPPSPLRMLPAAGLNFGGQSTGKTSVAQTITLFNDPADPNSATVNFLGRFTVSGPFTETDDCPFSFAPGSSCTLSIAFKPSSKGFNSGTIGIFYTLGTSNQAGNPQTIYLRGIGQ